MNQQEVRDAIMQAPEPHRTVIMGYIQDITALVTQSNETMASMTASLAEVNRTAEGQNREILRMKVDKERRDNILRLCKEALAQLRLDTKYMIFDLQCTRDERDDAQRRLGEKE